MKTAEHQKKIEAVASEINGYISKRPNTAETMESITQWWTSRQQTEESVDIVEDALEHLVNKKKLTKRHLGRKTLYMLTTSFKS